MVFPISDPSAGPGPGPQIFPPAPPEIDDPLLVADLIRLLKVKGAVGRMELARFVIPTVSLGDVVQPTVEIRSPSFRSSDVFSAGQQVGAAINFVHADTTALVAGVFDIVIYAYGITSNVLSFLVQHRNAANAANLMEFALLSGTGVALTAQNWMFPFAYEFGTGERLRVINNTAFGGTHPSVATIFARLRT